ncbi:choice-of-anchor L domain-containing protein [Pacificoceanicola onchidii]|uniref:choice-of-anchor L domain-containing protein n=1 Tax=Pacificoceanicola onchidii TaxID=2562685 RepID=UPI0010A3522C|nr:choice-of-anchor L domain-containing protein [Pacificoceanicola onchidii]
MPTASELPVNTGATALDMANEMFGDGITVVSSSYTGAASASGTYSDGDAVAPGVTPSDTGVILSTGQATSITNSAGDVNTSAGTSTNHGTAGDAELNAVSGQTTFDAAILEAEFVPEGSTLTMQIVFSSEEYLEYANSGFNDAVGIWVNGVQAQLTVGDGEISIDNINDTSNENLYVDNAQTDDLYNTEMDGFTVTLTLKAPVNPGEVNTIKIGIADGGDGAYDSNLLIAGDSVQTALVAGDDELEIRVGNEQSFDLLENDASSEGGALTITEINGNPVSIGDMVTLPTGQEIELTANGFVVVSAGDEVGEDFFTYTVADEFGNTDVANVKLTTTPCFVAGTLIETPRGPKSVEALAPGDLVETLDHGPQPVVWVGQSIREAHGASTPITFNTSRFGPYADTHVSPQHRILLRGPQIEMHFGTSEVFARAQHLVDETLVTRAEQPGSVSYVHLLFARHEIVFANGLASESFQPGDESRNGFGPMADAGLNAAIEQNKLNSMSAARPCLRKHEAHLLLPLDLTTLMQAAIERRAAPIALGTGGLR